MDKNTPDQPSAFEQAVALYQQGKFQEALEMAKRGLAVRPENAKLLNLAGAAAHGLGSLDEAECYWRVAIEAQPDFADAHNNLGNLLRERGRLDQAEVALRQALAIRPQYAEAHYNLGLLLQGRRRAGEAEAAYRRALAAGARRAPVYNNLGVVLQEEGRLEEAEAAYRQALVLDPRYAQAHYNLGNLLSESGRLAQALAAYRQALDSRPDYPDAISQLFHHSLHACDWCELAPREAYVRTLVQTGAAVITPFSFLVLHTSPAEQLACAAHWARSTAAIDAAAVLTHRPGRRHERIRLGYLSADFQQHATAYLMAELFERHDRGVFEVVAYSFGPNDGSAMRARLTAAFDRFVDIRALSPAEAATRIYADEMDILVDLKGYTSGCRPAILAQRPAPIQVNYLGYPGTMGAPFIDYLIADAFVAPFEQQRFYSEALVHLPHCYQPNDTQRAIAARTPTRAECGLPETGFVFCCFNNNYKITPEFFDIWMRLLKQTPGSVLWLLEANTLARDNLRHEALAREVDPRRLVFAPCVPLAEHLARHRLADLFLDTLPVNAHTAASDALWAGLPVLTCVGESFIGRVAGSLLCAVGLPDLVTDSPVTYEALALRLAGEPDLLAGLRARLAANRVGAPLFDSGRLTRHLEVAYQRMWERWCAGLGAVAFAVPSS